MALAHVVTAGAAATAPDSADARRPSLRDVFGRLLELAVAKDTTLIAAICAVQRVGVAVLDGCAEVYYMH